MIYLVRHGQTEFNLERRYQGGLDSPLTALGREQGRRLGALLAGLIETPADWTLVASPQGRAQATAGLIQERLRLPTPIETEPRLREITLGDWDGLTDEDIAVAYPGALDGLNRWDWHFHAPKGERYESMATRLGGWLQEAERSQRRLVVVSHGMSGRILRGHYAGLSRDEALRLDVPQDAVFRLADGRVERIDAPQ